MAEKDISSRTIFHQCACGVKTYSDLLFKTKEFAEKIGQPEIETLPVPQESMHWLPSARQQRPLPE